jgi:hypothetical protein
MDLSSETRCARFGWPWTSALVLMLVAAPAYADEERQATTEKSIYFPQMENPCFREPADNGETRSVETVGAPSEGRLIVTTKTKHRGDFCIEERTHSRGKGFATGHRSLVKYDVFEDHLLVTRQHKRTTCRTVQRDRQMGHPREEMMRVGTDGECSIDNPAACARPFVVTFFSDTGGGDPRMDTDEKCRDRDGKERGDDDHGDDGAH